MSERMRAASSGEAEWCVRMSQSPARWHVQPRVALAGEVEVIQALSLIAGRGARREAAGKFFPVLYC